MIAGYDASNSSMHIQPTEISNEQDKQFLLCCEKKLPSLCCHFQKQSGYKAILKAKAADRTQCGHQ